MNSPEDLNRLYTDVSDSIGSAMADILALNVEHKDGKREIGNITDKLRDIRGRFDSELQQLKTHAEWDTFTLAFFGETNAGKLVAGEYYTDTICGAVSDGVEVNNHSKSVLRFWPLFVPATAGSI